MITNEQLELIRQVDGICRNCIRAIRYWGTLSPAQTPYWITFTGRCYGEIAAIQWCHLFKSYRDKTHFTQLFGITPVSGIAPHFTPDAVRSRLLHAAGLTMSRYEEFWGEMTTFRDSIAAHWDPSADGLVFPDLQVAECLCLELRAILKELVDAIANTDDASQLLQLKTEINEHTNELFLTEVNCDVEQLTKMKRIHEIGRTR